MGQCDRVRRTEEGEEFWQQMMKRREEVPETQVLANVDPSPLLDDDETWEDWRDSNLQQDPDLNYYRSGSIYFLQTAGFEFIWGTA